MDKPKGSFVRYAAVSGLCFLLDYGLFTLLNAVLLRDMTPGWRETAATYGARIVSAVVNFLLNRNVVFRDASDPRRSAVRYLILAVCQAAASTLLVFALQRLTGASELIETAIKIPVDMGLFLLSYQIQKRWVFKG